MATTDTDDLSVLQEQFVRGRRKPVPLQFVSMADNEDERRFNERVQALMKNYRLGRNFGHKEMAVFLGLSEKEDYKIISYERSGRAFPAYLVWRFSRHTGIAIDGVPQPTESASRRPVRQNKNKKSSSN